VLSVEAQLVVFLPYLIQFILRVSVLFHILHAFVYLFTRLRSLACLHARVCW